MKNGSEVDCTFRQEAKTKQNGNNCMHFLNYAKDFTYICVCVVAMLHTNRQTKLWTDRIIRICTELIVPALKSRKNFTKNYTVIHLLVWF